MISNSKYRYENPSSLLERAEKNSFSILILATFCLKPWGIGREPNFVIFLVWSAIIICAWMVVTRSRKSCLGPAEIATFLFKDGDPV